MKKLVLSICAVLMTVFSLGSLATMSPAYAATPADKYITGTNSVNPSTSTPEFKTVVKNIINAILGIVGIVAVVMMIVGGINFIISQGEAAKVAKARNTILYGIVGLIIAVLAFAIVNFVLTEFIK